MSLPFTAFSKDYLDEIKTSITKHVTKTPVLSNKIINSICGAEIFFKCENFQKSGSFKFRAATNAVLNLDSSQKKKWGNYSFLREFCTSVILSFTSTKYYGSYSNA